MDARRNWLRHLATSNSAQKWARSCDPGLFAGTVRVRTRNTTYLFRNGSCFAVTTGDSDRPATSDFVGMKLVGWLLGDRDQLFLTREWKEGVCAVLWGAGREGELPVALTSPTERYAHFGAAADARPVRVPVPEPEPTYTRANIPMHPGRRPVLDSAVQAIARAF
jgi:hypothetical protein